MEIALLIALSFTSGVIIGYLFSPKEQRIYHYHDAKEDKGDKEELVYNPSYADKDYKQWFDQNK